MRRRLPRRSPEETRALMLEAATRLVCAGTSDTSEEAVSAALAHIRVKRVTEEATRIMRERLGDDTAPAITTGSIYQIWPAQADFQADLLFHLTSRQAELVPGLPESIRRFKEAVDSGTTWQEALNDVLTDNHENHRVDPVYRVLLGFYASAANPRVRDALGHYGESFTEVACEAYQALLDAYGLRLRAPYRIEHLATTIAALLDGFHMRWMAGLPHLEDPEGTDRWSLATRSAVMVFDQFTEPAQAGGRVPASTSAGRLRTDKDGGA
ncbi:hypothetical protein P1P68_35725 [Streptomyces scabiei]|uniref:hypothetical protein n=1 Tax=Streptomyces scabiei TaxID=1930 RepID=UPI002990086A|nr:hypothetical protein [Streptomyces scabiei]MDW8810004.1 hypothetical protein [Streptomyces scabiei]